MTHRLVVELDDEIYEAIAMRADQLGFESPEAYCALALQTVIEEVGDPTEKDQDRDLKENLRDLGYLE
ncbi:hypothetical protein [Halosimplex amylolyticum]|uniref:hypothetical protein n=1 Tax=Halosimplex amylolyticum TaxID=3396616 RepID=UPI003F55C27A